MRQEDAAIGVELRALRTEEDTVASAAEPASSSDIDLADSFRSQSYDLMSKHPIPAAHLVLAAASIAPECAAEQDVADQFSYVIVDFARQLGILHRRAVKRRAEGDCRSVDTHCARSRSHRALCSAAAVEQREEG